MRRMTMLAAAIALAACGTAEREDARAADASALVAPKADPAAADTTPGGRRKAVRGTDGLEFIFHRSPVTEAVDSVAVLRAGLRVQTLVPSRIEEVTPLRDPTWRIDLDFDGYLDFALVTLVPASPNPMYDYWRYDAAAGRFRYVGEYEMFDPDSTSRTLYTHARLGHAGRSWTSSRWRWENGGIVEIRRNEQVPVEGRLDGDERWIYRESELRGGRLVVVKADTMENCEAEPLPDECVPPAGAPAPAAGVQGPLNIGFPHPPRP
ncbi:MAG TPA: hypothetical protein VF006_23905 [Longimicrobium sp.]